MKYLINFLIYLPALQFIPGFLILFKAKPVVDNMAKLNMGHFLTRNFRLVGLAKIILLVLFFVPATMNLGFLLLCSWYGGAIIVHLSSNDNPSFAVITLVSLWVSAYLSNPSLFHSFLTN